MADLSLDITVCLNLTDRVVEVTDVTTYPEGMDKSLVKGIITVTQPDGVTVFGDWNAPAILYSGGGFNVGKTELRTTTSGSAQNGSYSVTYEVDHPDYTPSKVTKLFEVAYEVPTVVLTENFDVFTPHLEVADTSDYAQGAWTLSGKDRFWSAMVGTVDSVAAINDVTSGFLLTEEGAFLMGEEGEYLILES